MMLHFLKNREEEKQLLIIVQITLWLAVQELTRENSTLKTENKTLKQDIRQIKKVLGI